MNNIKILSAQLANVRNYVAFMTYDGVKLRLDWSVSLDALEDNPEDMEAHIERLMFEQAANDVDDRELIEEIRAKGVTPGGKYNLQYFLDRGYEEVPGTEFKRLAQERFPDANV